MEMLPPAPSVVVGAAVEKRFPGYGTYRGTIEEINGGKVLVHWAATDERTTLTLKEAAKRVVASPMVDEDDDDETAPYDHSNDPFLDGDATADYEGDGDERTASSRFWGVCWFRREKKWMAYYRDTDCKKRHLGFFDDEEEAARAVNKAIRNAGLEGRRRMNPVDATGALVLKALNAPTRSWMDRDRSAVVAPDAARAPTATTSKFWGVTWAKKDRRWQARYIDANGKTRYLGYFDTQEQAAHAVNAAIRRAGLEGKRRTNPVDATGALVPRERTIRRDRSGVVAPDPSRDPTATTSKYWGVTWNKGSGRWHAKYLDADGKSRFIGLFDTQEAAARAYNAAIRRAGLEGRRKTNPVVVDGQLVPRAYKRRRDEPAAATPRRSTRRR